MKNLFLIIAVIFTTLLTSCSKEEVMNSMEENKRVCIFADFPEDAATTRAQINIDATHKLRCILEVWTKEMSPALVHREEVAVEAGSIPPFEFDLKAGDYNCLLWADFIERDASATSVTSEGVTYEHFEELYYDTNNLQNVSIKHAEADNLFDTDLCDAFFAQLELKKEENGISKQLKLARPFSKLIVKEKDTEKFSELKKLKVVYEVPKGFNVLAGELTGEVINAIHEKAFETGDTSQLLFTNYIFASSSPGGTSLGNMMLSFTTKGKIDCEVAAGSIVIKRNEKVNASGNLIMEGTVDPGDPDPEPGRNPLVGDYFFIDGTWDSELTAENVGKCWGIVYAIGLQPGDDIANYGETATGKEVLGYVMALKNINTSGMGLENSVHAVSGRPYLYKHTGGTVDGGVALFDPIAPDKVNFTGYTKTNELLNSTQFAGHATDWSYPALQALTTWRTSTAPTINNASEWYIPSIAQLYAAAGGCYGVAAVSGYPGVDKIDALNAAFDKAISMKAAEAFTTHTGAGYYVYTSCLNKQTATGPGPCLVQINKDGTTIKPKEHDAKAAQGVIRPMLTIIK